MSGLESDGVRIDKWLWAARFFRTRGLATDAIRQGQIQCNGVRPKPSRLLRRGDCLQVKRGDELYLIEVLGLSERRGPAAQAQQLYQETESSRRKREEQAELRRAARLSAPRPPAMRPDKHARGQIRRMLGK